MQLPSANSHKYLTVPSSFEVCFRATVGAVMKHVSASWHATVQPGEYLLGTESRLSHILKKVSQLTLGHGFDVGHAIRSLTLSPAAHTADVKSIGAGPLGPQCHITGTASDTGQGKFLFRKVRVYVQKC